MGDEHLERRILLKLQQREMVAKGRGDTRAGVRTLMRSRGAVMVEEGGC
jgi:hypothetical protein